MFAYFQDSHYKFFMPYLYMTSPHRELAQVTLSQQQTYLFTEPRSTSGACEWYPHKGPVLQRASCLAYCCALIILKFIMMVECGAHIFILHWASQITELDLNRTWNLCFLAPVKKSNLQRCGWNWRVLR